MSNKKHQFRSRKVHTAAEAFQSLVDRKGDPAIERRLSLWSHWDSIMGSPIIDLGFPIETKGKNIIMGTENSMAMQELSMLSPTILHRVNEFLGEKMFTKVIFVQGEEPAKAQQAQVDHLASIQKTAMPAPPKQFGKKLADFSDDSLVSQCYRAVYSAYFPQESDNTEK